VTFTIFALFMGAAMSVTAFPVLARILTERNMLQTRIGAVTIACAAVDDVTAWFMLAGITVLARSAEAGVSLWLHLCGAIVYITVMVFGMRRILAGLESSFLRQGRLTPNMMGLIMLFLMSSALAAEWLGMHALFGSFLAGTVMPKGRDFARELTSRLDSIAVLLLLPLFFAFTGLRVKINLLTSADMWFFCAVIITIAIIGKLGGSLISAYMSNMSWREAGAIGALMNARGLMELVILNIGFEIGVISQTLFSMMVIMALVTTFIATPLLDLIYAERKDLQDVMSLKEMSNVRSSQRKLKY
jgi:Kef-type K+ transport system membrane component KefB